MRRVCGELGDERFASVPVREHTAGSTGRGSGQTTLWGCEADRPVGSHGSQGYGDLGVVDGDRSEDGAERHTAQAGMVIHHTALEAPGIVSASGGGIGEDDFLGISWTGSHHILW